ncbi:MAG: hypothetical protein FJY77_00745 [Candidatus Altiarchaeales archaeon]|nr:hypothetical protein [Candidatus Altiarchaeales archaeon]
MEAKKTIALSLVIAVFLTTFVSAKETSGGIVSKITDIIKGIINSVVNIIKSITGSKTTTTTVTTTQPKCTPPMIEVGKKCCLDENNNGICDKDEATTTTAVTTKATTTTARTTQRTTTEPTIEETTTTTIIKCKTNLDCGTSLEVKICYEKAIYKVTQIPMCKNPGTPQSLCYIKQVGPSVQGQLVGKIEDCEFGCDPKTVTCR